MGTSTVTRVVHNEHIRTGTRHPSLSHKQIFLTSFSLLERSNTLYTTTA